MRNRIASVQVLVGILGISLFSSPFAGTATAAEGLGIFEDNPRYFTYAGEPVFLTGRSFGWTVISDPVLDYVRDIETNAAHGGNLLRLTLFWPSHGEEGGELPWVRNEEGIYDLDTFNSAYFERLRHYLSVAHENQTVVSLELFDTPAVKGGGGRWAVHPMNPRKNSNYGEDVFGTSSADTVFFRTLPEHDDNPVALAYQRALARKVLEETIDSDNVIYSLGNECTSPLEWNTYWAAFIREQAAELGKDTVYVTNMWRRDIPEFNVFDIHDAANPYRVRRASAEAMWNAYQALYAQQREHDRIKPVYDSGQMGGAPGSHILHQVWMSFVGGTAGMRYHRMAPVHPRPGVSTEVEVGNWEDPHHLQQLRWIQHLREFIEDMEFWTMNPLWDASVEGEAYGFGRPGEEYVLYLPQGGTVSVRVPSVEGNYTASWFNPDNGERGEDFDVEVDSDTDIQSFDAPDEKDWVLHLRRG